jgi:hypothetical protein
MMFASMIEIVIMPRFGTGVYAASPLTAPPHQVLAPLPHRGRGQPGHKARRVRAAYLDPANRG